MTIFFLKYLNFLIYTEKFELVHIIKYFKVYIPYLEGGQKSLAGFQHKIESHNILINFLN